MDIFTQDICWIYITESKDCRPRRYIIFCPDGEQSSSVEQRMLQGERLVYSRRFDNTFDALAHKLMLERLSYATLSSLIRKQAARIAPTYNKPTI